MVDPVLTPPVEVARIAATLREAGFEAWAVGGAVRDALLGHAHLDWDLATSARPEEVRRLFKRTIPVGIEFGTVGVLDRNNVMHEVTTFRKDVKTDGRHAVVEFGVSLDDDLARRDFTINAIAFDPATGEIRDPFDGRTDLKRGIVRAVGVAGDRMREDRLRALRAIRFAARFGFNIEPATLKAIRESAPHMTRLSAERVKQELEKTMQQVPRPSVALEWWRETGALEVLVPAIAAAPAARFRALDFLPVGSEQEGISVDAKGAVLDRLAMLFFGEAPKAVDSALKALKFSNADAGWIGALARARAQVGAEVDGALHVRSVSDESGGREGVRSEEKGVGGGGGVGASGVDPARIRRWVAVVGRTRAASFCRLTTALHVAQTAKPDPSTGGWATDPALRERLSAFATEAVVIAYRDPIEIADLAVDGEDLRAAGVPDGPEMGRILKALLDVVVRDPSANTTAGLVARVKAGLSGQR